MNDSLEFYKLDSVTLGINYNDNDHYFSLISNIICDN